jgi:HEAT repeat protein
MSTVDIFIMVGFVFLLVVVVFRIWMGRRKPLEQLDNEKIRQPGTVKEPVRAESARKESSESASPEVEKTPTSGQEHATVSPESKPVKKESEEAIDPLVLIKTFSAPLERRIAAMHCAGDKKMIEAVPALIEALYEPDSSISAAAADALGKIGDPRAIEPLLEISRRNDVQLMKEISESRESEAEEEKEASPEVDSTAENPYNFKEMVVFKIDQLPKEYFQSDGTPIPRKDLVIRGLKDNNQQLRQMAAKAAIGLDNEDVVDPLIEALENPYEVESVRFMAAEALGGMGTEKSTESLLKALKDDNVAVRYSAAAALSGRHEESVTMALIGAITDPDKYVRSSVAYALGATRHPMALNVLFDCVADESEVVSFSAAKAIACFDSEQVVKEVRNRLEFANKKNKLALLEILGHIKSGESVEILRDFLGSSDLELSYKASMALIGQENLEILDELIEASKRFDQELVNYMRGQDNGKIDTGVSANMSESFKNAGKSLNVPESLHKFREGLHDKNHNIRGSAANALGDSKDPLAVDLLLEVIDDENEFVRASAINSLGRIGDEKALKFLVEKTSDYSEEVRYALVKSLAKFPQDGAKICLKRIAKSDPSNQVKRAARAALDKK